MPSKPIITALISFSLLAVALLAVGADGPPSSQPAAASRPAHAGHDADHEADPYHNPHGHNRNCAACHAMDGERALPIDPLKVDGVCMRCHDGRHAPAERHPLWRTIPSRNTKLPKGWPAPAGRLGCMSCHDISLTLGHERFENRPKGNPFYLRGGPYADSLTFCASCHASEPSQQARFNPHRMRTADGRNNDTACAFCHTRTFNADELTTRTGNASLKAGGVALCMGCHRRHVDWFDPGHIGASATPGILDRLTASMSDVTASAAKARLPLESGRTVVCATCHNPHETGVFPKDSMLAIGAIAPRSDTAPASTTLAAAPTSQPANAAHATGHPGPVQPTAAVRLGANLCGECHGK